MLNKMFAASLSTLILVSTAFGSSIQQTIPHNSAPINVSFVQTAPVSQFTVIDKKNGVYKLTLFNAAPRTTYFSDRPNRVVGQFINKDFLAKWDAGKDSFKQNPPNAVLSAAFHNEHDQDEFINYVIELTKPVYSSKETLSYQAKILDDNNHPISDEQLHHTILFIDQACLSCVG